jgi:anaerobic ribonucleoside-triphosphate reductase
VIGETRIVGYFSPIQSWNLSKLAELRARQRGRYAVEGVQA